jgi:hypothetical protein
MLPVVDIEAERPFPPATTRAPVVLEPIAIHGFSMKASAHVSFGDRSHGAVFRFVDMHGAHSFHAPATMGSMDGRSTKPISSCSTSRATRGAAEPPSNDMCPLCGEPNRCRAASPTITAPPICWCMGMSIDAVAMARLAHSQLGRACLCARCAGGAAEPEAP